MENGVVIILRSLVIYPPAGRLRPLVALLVVFAIEVERFVCNPDHNFFCHYLLLRLISAIPISSVPNGIWCRVISGRSSTYHLSGCFASSCTKNCAPCPSKFSGDW